MTKNIVKLTVGHLSSKSEEEDVVVEGSATPKFIDKRAMLVYCGKFDSMEGPVEITEEHLSKMVDSHNSFLSKLGRLANGEVPVKALPPIQLDHSTSAKDTVGRLRGNFEIGDHEVDGEKRKALFGQLRILGSENVEKVMDGRWSNLSIGADLETGKINELTITPFPAAADASLLSRLADYKVIEKESKFYFRVGDRDFGPYQDKETAEKAAQQYIHNKKQGKLTEMAGEYSKIEKYKIKDMDAEVCQKGDGFYYGHLYIDGKQLVTEDREKIEDVKADLELRASQVEKGAHDSAPPPPKTLSEGNKMDQVRLKKYLMRTEKLTDEAADAKLKALKDDEVTKLSEKVEADAKERLTQLSKSFKDTSSSARLTQKKASIHIRLTKLKASAKITPAEVKKIEIDKLASENEATIDAVMKTYEDREPVILVGMFGNVNSEELSKLQAKMKHKELEKETIANMPFLAQAKANMAKLNGTVKLAESADPAMPSTMSEVNPVDMTGYDEMCALMDKGDVAECKKRLKDMYSKYMSYMAKMGSTPDEYAAGAEAQMKALAETLTTMQTKFEEVITLTSEVSGIQI